MVKLDVDLIERTQAEKIGRVHEEGMEHFNVEEIEN